MTLGVVSLSQPWVCTHQYHWEVVSLSFTISRIMNICTLSGIRICQVPQNGLQWHVLDQYISMAFWHDIGHRHHHSLQWATWAMVSKIVSLIHGHQHGLGWAFQVTHINMSLVIGQSKYKNMCSVSGTDHRHHMALGCNMGRGHNRAPSAVGSLTQTWPSTTAWAVDINMVSCVISLSTY